MPAVIDQVALARLYGEPLFALPHDLYIPPDALQVFLEAFEGPLDLLLYLIRKQNFNILDIPMAAVTRQYLVYVDEIRSPNLELAAEYLLMAAMLIEIKSRMLLPPKKVAEGQEPEDPRAELVRRLLEYEQIKLAAHKLNEVPQFGRDFLRAQVYVEQSLQPRFPDVQRGRPAGRLARHRQARPPGAAPRHQPRRTFGARAHEHRAAQAAGPQVPRVRRPVRRQRGMPVLVVTFIALLELSKEGLLEVTQAEAFAPIYVRLAYSPELRPPRGPLRLRPRQSLLLG
jgi:segregation and condensation protein A